MTIHISNVQRARIYEEPAGSFATDHSGTAGDYKDLPFIEGSMNLQLLEPLETPGTVQQHIDAYPIMVHMPKRAKASFEINLTSLGLEPSGPREQSALGRLLKVAFGGETLGTGSTITTGASTTSLPLSSAAGIGKGTAIAVGTGTGGKLEMREVKNVSGNTVTLKHALSSSPANGATVYSCACYYPSTVAGASGACTSLQMICEGLEPDDRWLLLGGQVSSPPKFTIANGAISRMSFEWEFADWFYADGASTAGDFVGPQLDFATYSSSVPIVTKASELRIFDKGTTSLSSTNVDASSYELTTSLAYTPHLAPGGTNNIVHWVRTRNAPFVSGSFTVPLEDQTWWTEKAQDDVRVFSLQSGSSPTQSTGGGFLLVAPAIQITDIQPADANGIRCQQVSWVGTIDTDITSPTANSDLHYAALRIHLF